MIKYNRVKYDNDITERKGGQQVTNIMIIRLYDYNAATDTVLAIPVWSTALRSTRTVLWSRPQEKKTFQG